MKISVRILSLILAVLMLASVLVSCTGTEDKKSDDTQATTTPEGEDVVGLPAMNWEGKEYRILGRDATREWAVSFEVWREELPEDVVGKAVYNRNKTISDKYGITVVGMLNTKFNEAAKTAFEAGEDLYDLVLLSPEAFHPFAMQGYLLDLYTLDYINMDHKAWMDYPNEQLTMGGKLYYTTNKFLIQDKNRSWLLYYNRELARELNLGYFETLVFVGEWTLDKIIELGKQATSDSDGQVGMTYDDRWGVAAAEHYSFTQFAYGAGFRFTDIGSDGYPKLVGATDKIISILDKVYSLTTSDEVYYCDQDYGSVDWEKCADQMFYEQRSLSLAMCVSALSYFGEKVSFEYGILPNPKYDEDQEHYYSIPNLGNGSLLAVPATVMDPSFAGFALEAISEESVDTTYNAYIETKCKLQDAFDEDAAKCLQYVFDGIVYDIAFISDLGGLGNLISYTLGGQSSNSYSRFFSRCERIAENELKKVRETYESLYQ